MKTIQEIAEELEVSSTTIRNHLQKLPQNLSAIKEKNIYKIDTDVEEFLKDNEYLHNEIDKKDNLIEDLTILLQQQQKLQLEANKELLKYKRKMG
ncbi:HTH domain-containing protein [Staphylococcus xylosus]|uniref:HTH domain-containing protein n=1 Tax=Staphylococcus xylosus TaxID=1288 RepID=UPI003F57D214